jgi:pimeloyl-ACP methyl ester carboxylesterase
VDPLTNPIGHNAYEAPAFDIIIPSIPGYGFSSAPKAPITPKQIGSVFHVLMTHVLGYDKYFTQGGDWGSVITAWMAQCHPETVAACHFNMLGLVPFVGPEDPQLTDEERDWAKLVRKRMRREGGYQAIQGTKPQTLAYGLTDSPIGLAAWITEKFQGWPNAESDQLPPFSMDALLTNIMIYWISGNINAANWLYISLIDNAGASLSKGERIEVPCGFAFFPWDLFPPPPESWVKRAYNVVHRTDMPSGGHFAAMERPKELIKDIQVFFANRMKPS